MNKKEQSNFIKGFGVLFMLYGLLTQVVIMMAGYWGWFMLIPFYGLARWFQHEVDVLTAFTKETKE